MDKTKEGATKQAYTSQLQRRLESDHLKIKAIQIKSYTRFFWLVLLLFVIWTVRNRIDVKKPLSDGSVAIPIQWDTRSEPFEDGASFLRGGPYSFAIDPRHMVFVPTNDQHAVSVLDWTGEEIEQLTPSNYSGRLSDMVYKNGRLYIGCFDEPKVLVFDARQGTQIQSIPLVDTYKQGPLMKFQPVTERLELDRQNNLHIIYIPDGTMFPTTNEAVYNWSGELISKDTDVPNGLATGVLTSDDRWVYNDSRETKIDMNGEVLVSSIPYRLSLDGSVSVFDTLKTLSGSDIRNPASSGQLIGSTNTGDLYGIVYLPYQKHQRAYPVALVCWKGGYSTAKVVKVLPANKELAYSLYAPGSRRYVVGADNRIYALELDKYPAKDNDKVTFTVIAIDAETSRKRP